MEEQLRSVSARGKRALARLRRGKAQTTGTEEAKKTDAEAKPDALKGVPKIAEKVRFWEEQDRINKELIPRVIKLHELFTQHVEGHQDVASAIAVVEARLAKRQKRVLILASAALVVGVVSLVLNMVL